MSNSEKSDQAGAGGAGSIDEPRQVSEAIREALSKVGVEASNVGRKVISQGRRREKLHKRSSKVASDK